MLNRNVKTKLTALLALLMAVSMTLPGGAAVLAAEPAVQTAADPSAEDIGTADDSSPVSAAQDADAAEEASGAEDAGEEQAVELMDVQEPQEGDKLADQTGEPLEPEVTVEPSEDGEKTFVVKARDIAVPAGHSGPVFAVWSDKGGTDDLVWYETQADENYIYCAAVDIAQHKTAGLYHVRVYLRDEGESDEDVLARSPQAETTFNVSPVKGKVSIVSVNGNKGTFVVSGRGISAPAGIRSVKFKVWPAAKSSAAKTFTGTYKSDGTCKITVNVRKFGRRFGTYKAKMTVTAGNGITFAPGTAKKAVKASNYIYSVKTNDEGTRCKIKILGANSSGKWAKSVKVEAWSKENGKNDARIYRAKQYKKHCWRAFIDTRRHVYGGAYKAIIRVDGNKAGTASFSLNKILSKAEKQAEARLDKTGRTLAKAFSWSVHMPYRSVNTGLIRNCDAMASYGFTNHCGNCGVMAATFYHMARRLGYKAHYVTGYVPLAGGGMGPHAWVEIVQDGRTWVYDPDFQHETGRNGFRIYYGCGGTWRYSAYSRVN